MLKWFFAVILSAGAVWALVPASAPTLTLLNASYDPTRELYRDINKAFEATWPGRPVRILQSHAGSAKQARAILDGLEADVATLAIGHDIDALVAAGLVTSRSPSPYSSAIVFLVRAGNPKAVRDWSDLVAPGIEVITPHPKTSGGARLNYLAAWGFAKKTGRDPREFVRRLFANVPVLDAGARASTSTFVERKIGDVLLAWESEALLATKQGGVEVVRPSLSIRAEPPVAIVDKVAKRRGTGDIAKAYLEFLYTPAGQEIIRHHHYRPHDAPVDPSLFTVEGEFGGWAEAHRTHFADGGTFDQIYRPGNP